MRPVRALPGDLGRSKKKAKFTTLFSKSPAINWLSAARLFLFGARDIWFVVGLPVFLSELGWSFYAIGGFLALWVIFYGFIQAFVPEILRQFGGGAVDGAAARLWAFILLVVPFGSLGALRLGAEPSTALVVGLAIFALLFAINSAVHSYLVLAYSEDDSVALNVGFYYMANAGGLTPSSHSPAYRHPLFDQLTRGQKLDELLAAFAQPASVDAKMVKYRLEASMVDLGHLRTAGTEPELAAKCPAALRKHDAVAVLSHCSVDALVEPVGESRVFFVGADEKLRPSADVLRAPFAEHVSDVPGSERR